MTSPSSPFPVQSALEMYMHLAGRIDALEKRLDGIDHDGDDEIEIAPEQFQEMLAEMLRREFPELQEPHVLV